MRLALSNLVSLVPLLALCVPAAGAQKAMFSVPEPRTYSGTLPCADCEGIRVTVDLFPDGSFHSRDAYLGKGRSSVDLGRWNIRKDGSLALRGAGDPALYWPAANGALRRLDQEGKEIRSEANHELKREAAFRAIEDPVRLSGTLTYQADAGRLRVCLTGQELPVALAGDNAALEREYAEKRSAPGVPLLVTLTARFSMRPGPDGKAAALSIVVDKLESSSPGETCAPPPVDPERTAARVTPEGKTWKLVSLAGRVVEGPDSSRAPHLSLDRARKQVKGYTGCNRLTGRYVLDGDRLSFSSLATSRAACPEKGELEGSFLEALERVTGYRLTGDRLVLLAGRESALELREAELD